MLYNIYCDETCHLENDNINVMALGAVWCPRQKIKKINQEIIGIKKCNGISPTAELKWTKISPARKKLYLDILNYFFNNNDLHFRAIVVPDKSVLNHNRFSQTHDDWYYKMYFNMLKHIFNQQGNYNIYIDIKDTHSHEKSQKLKEVCCNYLHDFSQDRVKRIQPIRSDELQIMQIVDILLGAVGYANRVFDNKTNRSLAKIEIIELLQKYSSCTLKESTSFTEVKLNLLIWHPRCV